MQVKVINKSQFGLPKYGTALSAGADVYANLKEAIGIKPGERAVVPTGLFVEIPEGYEIQVRPRSGLAAKFGVTVLNTPGTIDADYRGEIGVILINHGKSVFKVSPGERVGQLVLNKFEQIEWVETTEITETERGEGGFGSTGVSTETTEEVVEKTKEVAVEEKPKKAVRKRKVTSDTGPM